MTLNISAGEVRAGRLTPEHLEAAVTAVREEGYVILNGVIDTAHLERLHERMLEDIPRYLERADVPFNWNIGNLQQAPPPFPPYLFRDVLVNDLVIAVTKSVLGSGIFCDFYSGNTALPGGARQPVHFDFAPTKPGQNPASSAYGFVINVPTLTMDATNGSTEIWPGTHVLIPSGPQGIKITRDDVERRRAVAPPLQPEVRRGGVLIRDGRIWHAGMPNHTQKPRPLIAMVHWIHGFRTGVKPALVLPRGTESLLAHPDLAIRAVFTEEPVDHTRHGEAYEYQPASVSTSG